MKNKIILPIGKEIELKNHSEEEIQQFCNSFQQLSDNIDRNDIARFANELVTKFSVKNSPNHVISSGDYNNPYDYILPNITVKDIIDFIKNYN